jgi:hypothetical protein
MEEQIIQPVLGIGQLLAGALHQLLAFFRLLLHFWPAVLLREAPHSLGDAVHVLQRRVDAAVCLFEPDPREL